MIAVDTNILVYAHREDSTFFKAANAQVTRLAEDSAPWAIPWPCLHEFLAIITNPKIYRPPTPMEDALEQIECWCESPSLRLIGEEPGYRQILNPLLLKSCLKGAAVHDGRIAAICQQHQVKKLWTADRDFNRIKGLKIENPLL